MIPMDELQQTSVSSLLKNRRTELGLSLAEIAARTHIRSAYLEALEEGRYGDLPGLAYQTGFLRNYAEVLGLGADRVLQQWRKETAADDGKHSELSSTPSLSSDTRPLRQLSRRVILFMLLLLAAAIVYYAWPDQRAETTMPMATSAVQAPAQEPMPSAVEPALAAPLVIPLSPSDTAEDAEREETKKNATVAGLPAALPAIPDEGGVVRLEALGQLTLEVAIDNRPLQRYVLNTASALQWDVARSARIATDNPAAAKIWLDNSPLDLAGRTEIVLQAATAE